MTHYQPLDWYQSPLFYDIVFDDDTEREARFLHAVWRHHVTSGGKQVLEPACGSGRLIRAFAEWGFPVTGYDLSQAMLDFARQRLDRLGLTAELVCADMASFRRDQAFDFAFNLVSSFKYLLDGEAAVRHLEHTAASLKPGGVYALGFHLSEYEVQGEDHERWTGQRDGVKVVCDITGWPPDPLSRLEHVRSRLHVREIGGSPKAEKRYETHWQFRTYDLHQARELIAAVPAFEHVCTYDFSYNIDQPIPFDGQQLDNILILRRR